MSAADRPQAVTVIRPPDELSGTRQGVPTSFGVSADSAGTAGLSMNLTVFPAGGSSKAHAHRGYETAIYGVSGEIELFYGDRLETSAIVRSGDFVFIPADVPHKTYNLSDSEPAVFVTARNDPSDQENVVVTPQADDGSAEQRVRRRSG